MYLIERSRERVADWLADFRERYDSFERVDERWELPPDRYEADRRETREEAGEPVPENPRPRPREGEIAAVEWFDAPPDEVDYPGVAERPFPGGE